MKYAVKYALMAGLLVSAPGLKSSPRTPTASQDASPSKKTQTPNTSSGVPHVGPNVAFNTIIPALGQKTLVPLRLPEYLPFSNDKETPLYVLLESAEPDRYSIQFAGTDDCEGGNACHFGYIGGSKTPFPKDGRRRVSVALSGGIKGSFANFDCGAHCDDASIEWSEGGYYYSIDLKAGDKKTLVRMANSAIQSRVKENH